MFCRTSHDTGFFLPMLLPIVHAWSKRSEIITRNWIQESNLATKVCRRTYLLTSQDQESRKLITYQSRGGPHGSDIRRFPNAGKSSLLCSVSHAKPQVANYAFTTVKPELGKIMYEDHRQVTVADLPGLIEGAHINKGMGHKFLKHIERTKQLLFVVDVFGFQLSTKTPFRTAFQTIQLLTKELELYKEELLTKPAILAVNKMDLPNAEDKLNELMKQLEHPADFLHLLPEDMIPETPAEFNCVLPISASTGLGVNELKVAIRKSLEDQYELEHEKYQKEKLQSLETTDTDQNFKRHKNGNSRLDIQ